MKFRPPGLPAAATALALLLAGCVQPGSSVVEAAAPVREESLVDRVAIALAEGERAEGETGDAGRLADASRFLAVAGARPAVTGERDQALHWAALAAARGKPVALPWRDRALGPAYRRGRIGPNRSIALEQIFLAGRKAEIALMPIGARARLVLDVTDGSGTLVCRKTADDPPARCGWLSVYTARHAIRVRNEGAAPADYYLVIR